MATTRFRAFRVGIFAAISVYVLVAIIKKRLHLDRSLFSILQVLSVSLLEKTPLQQLLTPSTYDEIDEVLPNQLILFN